MTGEILNDILHSMNQKLKSKGRSVLLFMDNAGCHPNDITSKYSNIKVLFLPPNCTSKLQPLDIKKCFRKAGILDQSFQVVSMKITTEDPFLDLDNDNVLEDDGEVQELVEQMRVVNPSTANELTLFDDDLTTCADLSDDNWEEAFLSEICPTTSKSVHVDPEVESESSDEESTELPSVRYGTLSEAIVCLEDVHQFLELKGHTNEATQAMSLITSLSRLHSLNLSKARRQTSLLEFLPSLS